jgi:biotin carboxyl carrier protein
LALEVVEIPIAGKIMQVMVKTGDSVKEGDILCMIESMKMENPIMAPVSGTVKDIAVSPGQVAKAGTVLAIIEY